MQSLTELGEEYDRSAELVTDMIESCKERMRKARRSGDEELVYRLRTHLRDLYAQRCHLYEIAVYLKTYYEKDERRIV